MTDRIQTGVHPDADQISLFLEGAATEHERAQMLDHLAGCAACREMVFLAQGAEAEPVAAAEEPRPARWWRRGWMPFGLAGAAVAFALALVIYMRQPAAPVGDRQVAVLQTPPANPVNAPRPGVEQKAQPTVRENKQAGGTERLAGPARKPSPAVGAGSGAGYGGGLYRTAPATSPAVAANDQMMEAARGNMARLTQNAAPAAPAVPPPAVVAPALASAPVALGANPVPQQQAQGGPMPKGRNIEALGVLRDQATTDGLSEVSGVVTDASGAAIAQASVSLNGGSDKAAREVATGPDGRFRIADVPAGKYELRVSARGFNTRVEPVELKAQVVAKLDSVLQVGAETQTVTVDAGGAAVETRQAELSGGLVREEKLPGGAAATAQVAMGGRMLTLDASGHLYLSKNAGKSWKKIKPKWAGKAAQLAVAPAAEKGGQVFELTTDAGAVWISQDGKHWQARAEGQR